MPNTDLLKRTLAYIEANPQEWNQRGWAIRTDCGTAYCLAGTAIVLSGGRFIWELSRSCDGEEWSYNVESGSVDGIESSDAEIVARRLLRLTADDAEVLFAASNDLDDLRRLVAELTASEPALDAVAGA